MKAYTPLLSFPRVSFFAFLFFLAGAIACTSPARRAPHAPLTEVSGLEEVSILSKGLE